MRRIVPIYTDLSKAHFVPRSPPREVEVTIRRQLFKIQTAPLSFDHPHDLIALSQNDKMLETGAVENTDILDAHVALLNVHIWIPGSGMRELHVQNMPYATASFSDVGDYKQLKIDGKFLVNHPDNPERIYSFEVSGKISLEVGSIHLDAWPTDKNDSSFVLMGYDIFANRKKPIGKEV